MAEPGVAPDAVLGTEPRMGSSIAVMATSSARRNRLTVTRLISEAVLTLYNRYAAVSSGNPEVGS
jgi:hypothetical protein